MQRKVWHTRASSGSVYGYHFVCMRVCVCLLFLSTITATVSRGCWTQGAQTLQRAILVGESRTKPTSYTSALSAEGMKRTEPKKKPNFQHSPDKLIAISWLP